MSKYKSFIFAAVFAILFLCSIESQSATLAKRTTCYVGEVKQSDIRMSIRLILENSKIGTLSVFKRHADLGKNKIEEFYFVSLESDTLTLSGELVYDIKYLFKREKQSACIYLIGVSPDGILFSDKDIRRITLRSANEKKNSQPFS